jgi:putative ABC transport system permease protein
MAGALGVVNTMMMSASERTREIGTLRALGATKRTVMKTFLSEAALIGVIGGLVGVGLGAAVSFALPMITGSGAASTVSAFGGPGSLFRGGLQTSITASNLLLGVVLGIIVGALAGIYPAWRASRMDPVEALRHV